MSTRRRVISPEEWQKPGCLEQLGLLRSLGDAEHPWRQAQKVRLWSTDYLEEGETLDPGVNFFVLMLNHLGASTRFSCEGHPSGFYVVFAAPYELALRIARQGYLTVGSGAAGTH